MVLALLACLPPFPVPVEGTGPVVLTTPTEPAPPAVAVDDVAGLADASGLLFSTAVVHQAALTLDEADRLSLTEEPYTWIEAELVFDGVRIERVGARLKGHIGSFRTLDEKASFKFDFDMFDEAGRTLLDVERFNLHNAINDATFLHDLVAGDLYRAVGIPAPRVGWVWLTIDGEIYGLYVAIEVYDLDFLARNYAFPGGNLYDGDYAVLDDGTYPHCDFLTEEQDNFVLDEGMDVGRADVHAVTEALEAGIAAVEPLVDVGGLQAYCAAESWVGQDDGYCFNSNNYRVYFDPSDGRARLMPWDHEAAFNAGVTIDDPYGALGAACVAEPDCRAGWTAARDALCQALDTAPILDNLWTAAALVAPWVALDPRMERDPDDVPAAQQELAAYVTTRCAAIAPTLP